MLKRGIFVAAISALATGFWFGPAAAVGGSTPKRTITRHKISETHRFARIGQGSAGFVDGRIGGTPVHGAFRSSPGQRTGPRTEIVRGTEFDARGSRSFVLHNKLSISSNGQVTNSATGTWTGGTGSYRHARGSFTLNGGGPVNGVKTSHLTGSIIY